MNEHDESELLRLLRGDMSIEVALWSDAERIVAVTWADADFTEAYSAYLAAVDRPQLAHATYERVRKLPVISRFEVDYAFALERLRYAEIEALHKRCLAILANRRRRELQQESDQEEQERHRENGES